MWLSTEVSTKRLPEQREAFESLMLCPVQDVKLYPVHLYRVRTSTQGTGDGQR